MYAEITDQESMEPCYATVDIATGKYTYNITTNTSYDTVMLHNMTHNACYGNAVLQTILSNSRLSNLHNYRSSYHYHALHDVYIEQTSIANS